MHFDILIEDQSGKNLVEAVLPKIADFDVNTFRIHCYKGIGRIPKHLNEDNHPRQRFLLSQLPKLLNGLGKTYAGYGVGYAACVVVICDLDDKNRSEFLNELNTVLITCAYQPTARFCLAIEECESWLLGDVAAVKKAYPRAKDPVLNTYVQASICGTWEVLADAIHPGGSSALKKLRSYVEIGAQKCEWATNIGKHMSPNENISPSFHNFREQIIALSS